MCQEEKLIDRANVLNENKCPRASFDNNFTSGQKETDILPCVNRPKVCIALDWENIFLSYSESCSSRFSWEEMRGLDSYLHEYYDVVVKKAYVDVSSSNGSKKIIDSFGYTIVNVPSRIQETKESPEKSIKNAVDGELTLDVYDSVINIVGLDAVVLLSGDGDFLSLVKRIKGRGKDVFVLAAKGHLSRRLENFATHVTYLEDILLTQQPIFNQGIRPIVQAEINSQLLGKIQDGGEGSIPLTNALQCIYKHLGLKTLKDLGVKKSVDLVKIYPVMFSNLRIEKNRLLESSTTSIQSPTTGGEVLC